LEILKIAVYEDEQSTVTYDSLTIWQWLS